MIELSFLILFIISAANMAVGGCIGICGIAGFLLPMLYTSALGFDVTYSLALSFLAFLISGLIGSFNYYKVGNLDVKMSVKLGIGSLIGAVAGVFLQGLIEKSTAKTILYLVVLFSGTSILIRIVKEYHKTKASKQNPSESTDRLSSDANFSDSISGSTISANSLKRAASENQLSKAGLLPSSGIHASGRQLTDHVFFLLFLGVTTGAVCSLSGAGGPVLVMPLLVACGVSARIAVGVALFDSVFIAVPACIGYLSRITWNSPSLLLLLLLIILTHGAGVWLGSRFAGKVPVQGLKIFVAIFSICIAIYMLL